MKSKPRHQLWILSCWTPRPRGALPVYNCCKSCGQFALEILVTTEGLGPSHMEEYSKLHGTRTETFAVQAEYSLNPCAILIKDISCVTSKWATKNRISHMLKKSLWCAKRPASSHQNYCFWQVKNETLAFPLWKVCGAQAPASGCKQAFLCVSPGISQHVSWTSSLPQQSY